MKFPTLDGRVHRRAITIALIVGSILNLINQGDALIALDGVNFAKLALTYCVPYCVSIYSAYSALKGPTR